MTNKEWIQTADADSLAKFIRWSSLSPCSVCGYRNDCYDEGTEEDFCLLGVKEWLKEEYEEDKF
jgi:hypothetical protein